MADEIKSEEVKSVIPEIPVEKSTDEVYKKMHDMLNLNEIADLINSNEKIFEFEGVTYKVTRPNFNQKQEVYNKKIEKYVEMLRNDKYLLTKDLKELYKKRGIDLDTIEINLKNKMKRRDDFMIKLGGEIKNNSNEETLQTLKKEIEELNTEIQVLSVEKSSLLEVSIEQQLLVFVYSYFVYLITTKKEGERWIKVWNNYDEFMNSKQALINRLSYYVTMIIGSEGL